MIFDFLAFCLWPFWPFPCAFLLFIYARSGSIVLFWVYFALAAMDGYFVMDYWIAGLLDGFIMIAGCFGLDLLGVFGVL